MTTDYRDTVFLPRTDFPMKADLPKREPEPIAALGRGRPLPSPARGLGRAAEVRPARRPALRQRPSPHGHGAQQDPQGRGQPRPADAGPGRALRARLGLPRPADRVADRAGVPQEGQGQGRGPDRRLPPRVPRVRAALDRHPARRVQAPGRARRLGRPLHHHELRGRGRHLPRARQVPALAAHSTAARSR